MNVLRELRYLYRRKKLLYKMKKDGKEKIYSLNISKTEKTKMLKDYKKANKKQHVSFEEYNQYSFSTLQESERNEFISIYDMELIYKKYTFPKIRELFCNKELFLKRYNKYIKRKWMVVNNSVKIEDLDKFISNNDCIIKKNYGSRGIGVKKINKGTDPKEILNSYANDGAILEECIDGNKEIQNFHPSSLNTIRVVTFSKNDKIVIFGASLRTGNNGSNVDNAHSGGIFSQIDIETGIVNSNGIDANGNVYINHPYSDVKFKGFKIPLWDSVKKVCIDACKEEPDIRFAGWDVAINSENEVLLIEGNYAPDFDLMQSPQKIGVKKKVYSILKELDIR